MLDCVTSVIFIQFPLCLQRMLNILLIVADCSNDDAKKIVVMEMLLLPYDALFP